MNFSLILKINKMTISIKNIILFSAFFFCSYKAFAQPDLPSEEIEVIKDFEAALEESFKINVKPELPPVDTTSKNLLYDVPSKTINVDYLPPKIRPIAMKRDPVADTYKGFLKLGYGIPSSPYGEVSYHSTDPKKYEAGAHFKHHSANFKDLENQRFSKSEIGLDGTYFHDLGFAINGDIGYNIDEVYFYGYNHDEQSYTREEIKQKFNTFNLDLKFFNGESTQGDINYYAKAGIVNINDNYAVSETSLDIDLGVTKWFNETHPLTVKIITDFTSFDTTEKQKLNNFYFQPSFTYHADIFKVKIGGNLTSFKDKFTFYPDIEATVNVIGNQLAAFAGWEGDVYKNNFKNITDYNPFVVSRFGIQNTGYNNFYGGVRGNVKILDYEVQAGLKKADDLALFLRNTMGQGVDTLRFNVLYDTVDVAYLKGTLNASPIKGLEVILSVGQNVYSLTSQEKAWGLPSLEVNLAAVLKTMEDKLRIKGELFVENGVPYINPEGLADNLNGLFDLSFGAHFQATKNFGIFFDLNNIANNKRQRWEGYPTYGINIIGGITARF